MLLLNTINLKIPSSEYHHLNFNMMMSTNNVMACLYNKNGVKMHMIFISDKMVDIPKES